MTGATPRAGQSEASIATAIVALARSTGLPVVAEGVETSSQLDLLVRQGCHTYQGYLFGRPGPVELLQTSGVPAELQQ
ncbi:MAG: EAL domain-containing protein [Sulfuritalea sp.]|nr:EAL domain-containing protein [Sulfuritalea sp.]